MTLTILEGSTFVICDDRGDVEAELSGFFAEDTRHLSLLRLTINGHKPLLLRSGRVDYFSAAFYLRNPLAGGLAQDALMVVRNRFVGRELQDQLVLENVGEETMKLDVRLEIGCDFADIFTVKDRDLSLGQPEVAPPLPPRLPCTWVEDGRTCSFDDPSGISTRVRLSKAGGDRDEDGATYRVSLAPRERWELLVDVIPSTSHGDVASAREERRFGDEVRRVQDSLAAWHMRVPRIWASWEPLRRTFDRSVADLAALRMRSNGDSGELPAAGMPWFMAVFGRDTIITCLQTLLFGPELAHTALHTLARLQALEDDPETDAEPGKIVHEVRQGKAVERWFARYYGTVDATPLYLILLSEVFNWTDDRELVETLREPALRALAWIDEYGDRDGDGFVEYERRTPRGLVNQSWKDSGDSQRFRDGRVAEPPIAPCEVQGYVFDAKRRLAVIAREVWEDPLLAARLEREADELRGRFNDAFWVDDRGGYYALALDREKRPVDSLTSNIGHLLWSGIVPEDRADAVVDRLMSPALWSGWGMRTMSTLDAAYNPLSYHNGTIWPHDNSLIAWGLARYGRWDDVHRVVQRMLSAAAHFDWELPEVFSGIRRGETPFPVPYPTASRPQAWAAGTSILLLQLLLGLQPDRRTRSLETIAPPGLPSWAGELTLTGVRAFGERWDVSMGGGDVEVGRPVRA